VFGCIERLATQKDPIKMRLFIVVDRTSETLLHLIKKSIIPGSIIYSDMWKGYNKVGTSGYAHHTVNHSKEFKSADGTCTNTIEGAWKHAKRASGAGNKRDLAGYLGEHTWRKSLSHKSDLFIETLKLIAKYHSGSPMSDEVANQFNASDVYHLHERGKVVTFDEFIQIREEPKKAKDALEQERQVQDDDIAVETHDDASDNSSDLDFNQ
jgi:transposase-like protein